MKFFNIEMSDICADKKKSNWEKLQEIKLPYEVKDDSTGPKPLPGPGLTKEQIKTLGL